MVTHAHTSTPPHPHCRHLLSSKVDVEPALEELVGHQGHAKLRGGATHPSWRTETGEDTQVGGDLTSPLPPPSLPPAPFHRALNPSSFMIFLKQSMTPV